MPSSYSPNLRIELIAPGEQAGTWGTTTNTNLGTLVEDAISGYVSVAVSSANQALTALNGAADQSRNAIINLTTSTSADFAVYAPPESKQYTIKNSSSFVATIYNSTALGNTTAAGTGVAIPAGRTISVWSDGTNFSVQNNLLVGNVIGDVVGNVTGQLSGTISSGTTGVTQTFGTNSTLMATTAFVQAALQALHPVGSIYINATNATNPGTLFGFGTWAAFGAGRVPVGFNAADPLFDSAEETGGGKDAIVVSHTHTLTASTDTAGDHFHNYPKGGASSGPRQAISIDTNVNTAYEQSTNLTPDRGTDIKGAHTHTVSGTTSSVGSSGINANLQPYITVYMWKRTA
jgi:hypothetical protein